MLLIDDLHLADEPSQALLAVLAHGETGQLLLVASAPQELHSSSSKALLGLRKAATHLHLAPLGAAQVRELLRSVFGDANYLERHQRVVPCPLEPGARDGQATRRAVSSCPRC